MYLLRDAPYWCWLGLWLSADTILCGWLTETADSPRLAEGEWRTIGAITGRCKLVKGRTERGDQASLMLLC